MKIIKDIFICHVPKEWLYFN